MINWRSPKKELPFHDAMICVMTLKDDSMVIGKVYRSTFQNKAWHCDGIKTLDNSKVKIMGDDVHLWCYIEELKKKQDHADQT